MPLANPLKLTLFFRYSWLNLFTDFRDRRAGKRKFDPRGFSDRHSRVLVGFFESMNRQLNSLNRYPLSVPFVRLYDLFLFLRRYKVACFHYPTARDLIP